MPFSVELLRGSQSGRSRADNSHFFSGAVLGRTGFYHPFQKRDFRNRRFVFTNGNGRFVQGQHARFFARRGTNPSGEIGEIVGFVQNFHPFFPFSLVNHILPLGHTVAQRTRPVTKRYPAVHTPRRLHFAVFLIQRLFYFAKVCNSLQNRPISRFFARNGYKCFWIAHINSLPPNPLKGE